MHEITVHHLFPYGFHAFFLKMGWKWEILSHWHFCPQLLSFCYLSTTRFQKKQKLMGNLNWCYSAIQPNLKICKFFTVFWIWYNLKFLILFCFFEMPDSPCLLGSRNSGLDLGNMKGNWPKIPLCLWDLATFIKGLKEKCCWVS